MIATSFIHRNSSEDVVEETSPFAKPVGSADEGGLEIDEEASTVSLIPNPRVFTDLNLAAMEGKECVKRALEEIEADVGSHADCRAEEATEGDSFVDIRGGLERDTRGESEGFTFDDILQRTDLMSETLLEGVVQTLDMPLC